MQEYMVLLVSYSTTILKILALQQLGVDRGFCLILDKAKLYYNIFHSSICFLSDQNVEAVLVMNLSAMVFAIKLVQLDHIQPLTKLVLHVVKDTIGMVQVVSSYALQDKISIHTIINVNVLQEQIGLDLFALAVLLEEYTILLIKFVNVHQIQDGMVIVVL